jgi:hypothetical protein
MKSIMSVLSILVLSGLAQAAPSTCLNLNDIGDHSWKGDSTLVLDTAFDGKYDLALSGGCSTSFDDVLVFKPFSSFELCAGDEVATYERGIGETGFCVIDAITKE